MLVRACFGRAFPRTYRVCSRFRVLVCVGSCVSCLAQLGSLFRGAGVMMNVPNCFNARSQQPSIPLTIPTASGGRPSVRDSPRRHVAARGVFRHARRQGGGGEVGVPAGLHLVPEGTGGSVISLQWRGAGGWGGCHYLQTASVTIIISLCCSEGRFFVRTLLLGPVGSAQSACRRITCVCVCARVRGFESASLQTDEGR